MSKVKTKPTYSTTLAERNYYGFYFAGQNVIYTFVTTYMVSYIMMAGVNATKIAAVVFAIKIWDAVNDTMFGVIFDKVKFKSGKKCTPWLKISTPFIVLTTVMMFWSPSAASANAKLAWFAVAYAFWDTAYTLCDVPIYTMVTTMTDNMEERNNLYSRGKIFGGIGSGIAGGLTPIFVGEKLGWSFTVTAVIMASIALILMVPAGFGCKERNYDPNANAEENFSIKEMCRYLVKNKYLLLYYLGYLIQAGMNTGATIALFVCFYLFNSAMFNTVISLATAIPVAVFALATPALLKKFDKRNLFFASSVIIAITSFILFFGGTQNRWLFIILTVIRNIPAGITGMLGFMFTPDCAEYGKYKSGIDAKGITFAIQTFSVKVAAAVSSSLGLAVLAMFKWQEITAASFEELEALGVTQTPEALKGLWIVYALLPAIGNLVALIPWAFYKLRDKDVQIMAKCNAGEITREEAESSLSRKY